MLRLLLISSSSVHGTEYLDHCQNQVKELFRCCNARRILFVPYALFSRDYYANKAAARFAAMGLELESIHTKPDVIAAVQEADAIFIGGGNTFRLLKTVYDLNLLEPIRQRVLAGMPYMGTSAGSNLASPTIMTTNDMPIVYPPGFAALNLVPFQINPHYLDPDPESTHMGESRDTRLREYHEENHLPVVAIREGAMIEVEDSKITVAGATGGKLFRPGEDPVDCPPGTRLDRLLF